MLLRKGEAASVASAHVLGFLCKVFVFFQGSRSCLTCFKREGWLTSNLILIFKTESNRLCKEISPPEKPKVEYGRVALLLWWTPLRACSSSLIRTAGTAVEFVPEQWRPDSTPFGACFAALPKPFGQKQRT
jgi:hypothetical protein